MKKIIIENLKELIKNKNSLEKSLGIKIVITKDEVFIEGSPENEYLAEKIIDALDFGFSMPKAISIKKEEFLFEIINIKEHTKRKDLQRIKARIIGTNGRTLRTLCQLTDCFFELKDYKVGIISSVENIKIGEEAVLAIIRGVKHANVYSFLEKKNEKEETLDLGLKGNFKKLKKLS